VDPLRSRRALIVMRENRRRSESRQHVAHVRWPREMARRGWGDLGRAGVEPPQGPLCVAVAIWILAACSDPTLTTIEPPPPETSCPDPANPTCPPEKPAPGSCADQGELPQIGDFIAEDGARFWLRQSPTVQTLTIVPAGPPEPSRPPEVYRARRFCPGWLLLENNDGAPSRLDSASLGGTPLLCLRAVSGEESARLLELADPADLAGGCPGGQWLKGVAP